MPPKPSAAASRRISTGKIFSASQRAASRQHPVGRELPRRVAEGLLVFGKVEIHARGIISAAPSQSNNAGKQAALRPFAVRAIRRLMPKRFTTLGRYPSTRLRRNRREDWSRRLVAETQALGRRPDLAGVRPGRQQGPHAGRLDARRRPPLGRPASSRPPRKRAISASPPSRSSPRPTPRPRRPTRARPTTRATSSAAPSRR